MIRFLLNDKEINTEMPPGMALLDFIRYHKRLTGTKIGCREGDCGACTVLAGEIKAGQLEYRSVTCCLMALGNAQGKHIVTIEGINLRGLNIIQQAMQDESATQCGFCTPGIVMSLAGFCLRKIPRENENTIPFTGGKDHMPTPNVIAAVDGNICRCTGYKSIERACMRVVRLMNEKNGEDPVAFLTGRGVLPAYFSDIKERLKELRTHSANPGRHVAVDAQNGMPLRQGLTYLGGGTDLYVQQHETMVHADLNFMVDRIDLKSITTEDDKCTMGASVTVTDLAESPVFQEHFPGMTAFMKLISSTPIRNMATVAGNIINASPIGDLTIFFLALDARLIMNDKGTRREMLLKNLYEGYKTLDKKPGEFIEKMWFYLPGTKSSFNFEKVSKRTHLDIASVNSAMLLTMDDDQTISHAAISAGGVGPVPLLLSKASAFLQGKRLSTKLVHHAIQVAQTEISPISDARGTANYKRLLLKQLIKAHFIKLFPSLEVEKVLFEE